MRTGAFTLALSLLGAGCDNTPAATSPGSASPTASSANVAATTTESSTMGATSRVNKGDPAPDVTLQLHDGISVALSSLRGSLVLLWFYPQDDTTG